MLELSNIMAADFVLVLNFLGMEQSLKIYKISNGRSKKHLNCFHYDHLNIPLPSALFQQLYPSNNSSNNSQSFTNNS